MSAPLELTKRELSEYSLTSVVRSLTGDGKVGGIEREISDTIAERLGRIPGGVFVPWAVLRRDLSASEFYAGGAFVGEMQSPIAQMLFPKSTVIGGGAFVIDHADGDIVIPRFQSGSALEWLAPGESSPNLTPETGSLKLTPHRLGGHITVSNELLMQSRNAEAALALQFQLGVAAAVDRAALSGTGSGAQPVGLLSNPATQAATFAGAAQWADVLEMEEAATEQNADSANLRFVSTPATRKKWRGIQRFSGCDRTLWDDGDMVGGHKGVATVNVDDDRMIVGDFGNLNFVVAFWGDGIDLLPNPYSLMTTNQTVLNCNTYADCGAVRPDAFVVSTDSAAQS